MQGREKDRRDEIRLLRHSKYRNLTRLSLKMVYGRVNLLSVGRFLEAQREV